MPPRILLADDSVTVRKVVELTFLDEGIDVVTAEDGREAIERIDAAPPDVVLADVSMPGCDGYAVCSHVKQTPALAHIPVVLMTGAFEQLDEARANELKCDGVLAKPFEPQTVIGMVRELLARGRGEAAEANGQRTSPASSAAVESLPGEAAGFPFEPGATAGRTPRTLDDFFDRIDEALTSPAASTAGFDLEVDARSRTDASPAIDRPDGPAQPPQSATLADAFSELLADELGESSLPASWAGVAPGAVAMPSPAASEASAAGTPGPPAPEALPVLTDALLDEVTRRVIQRMSDEVVRAEVARHVIDVAERLVREEIDRLKR
jgi:CheY-like chemotaxis protein